jgi:hypothetical protein
MPASTAPLSLASSQPCLMVRSDLSIVFPPVPIPILPSLPSIVAVLSIIQSEKVACGGELIREWQAVAVSKLDQVTPELISFGYIWQLAGAAGPIDDALEAAASRTNRNLIRASASKGDHMQAIPFSRLASLSKSPASTAPKYCPLQKQGGTLVASWQGPKESDEYSPSFQSCGN